MAVYKAPVKIVSLFSVYDYNAERLNDPLDLPPIECNITQSVPIDCNILTIPTTDCHVTQSVPIDCNILTIPTTNCNIVSSTTLQCSLGQGVYFYSDSFGRQKTVEPATIFAFKHIYAEDTLTFDTQITNSGGTGTSVYSINEAKIRLQCAGSSTIIRQTYQYFNYNPGVSQLILITGIFGEGNNTTTTKTWGYGDAKNGLFFKLKNGILNTCIRSYSTGVAVDTDVAQTSFSNNPLPNTSILDVTKMNIYFIEFGWLGIATVNFGILKDGQQIILDSRKNENSLTKVYMSTPNLPIHYKIQNTGVETSYMDCVCCAVESQGPVVTFGTFHTVNSFPSSVSGFSVSNTQTNTYYPLIGIKCNKDGLQVVITSISIVNSGSSNPFEWLLILNPTLSGGAFSINLTTTNSNILYGNQPVGNGGAGSTTVALANLGTVLQGGVGVNNTVVGDHGIAPNLRMGKSIAGVYDIIYLVIRCTGGTNLFYANLEYNEF